jgi:hypothetical protein
MRTYPGTQKLIAPFCGSSKVLYDCSLTKRASDVPARVTMSGPTRFSPCLKKFLDYAVRLPCTQVGAYNGAAILLRYHNVVKYTGKSKVSHRTDHHRWRFIQR